MYGFHKQRHPLTQNYFQHESFRRGQNLCQIKRKPEKKKKTEQQILQSKKLLNFEEEPKENMKFNSLEQIGSDAIINPQLEQMRDENENQKEESSPCVEAEIKNANTSHIGSLFQKAILQNQILVKLHKVLMSHSLNLKKQRLSRLVESQLADTNLDTASYTITLQTVNTLNQIIKAQTMKLYSILDFSN